MDLNFIILNLIGKSGIIIAIGLMVMFFSFRNSLKIFQWVEDQTFGTRDYILKKCELLFYEISSEKVTWILISLSVGSFVLTLTFFSIFGLFVPGLIIGLIFLIVGWKIPKPLIDFFVQQRIKKYQVQMVDALNLLSNGLRAGLSINQSVGMVVGELPNPIAQEFNLILQQNRIGVPFEECLENLKKRIPTEDNEMFVTSVNILKETGGNLAETFDTIAEVIRERVRLGQKIETYTAQGKIQGLFIFLVPFFILIMFSLSDPAFAKNIFGTISGVLILAGALILNFIGGFFILKIAKIKV